MAVADFIYEASARWKREDRARAYDKAVREGYAEVLNEAYNLGFADAEAKKPYRLEESQSLSDSPSVCPACGARTSRPKTARDDRCS